MKHPSPLVWFKLHAGDLPLPAWLGFRLHVARCAECKARLAKESSERAGIEALLDGARPAAARARATSAASRAWLALPVAALALVVFLVVRARPDVVTDGGEELRAKGGSSTFLVFVAVDGGTNLLGATCKPNDALQAQYRTSKREVLVVGVDPSGVARALAPLDGKTSEPAKQGLQSLSQSWILDAAPGRERFVAFFSDAPIDVTRASEAAKVERPALEGTTAIVRECTKAAR